MRGSAARDPSPGTTRPGPRPASPPARTRSGPPGPTRSLANPAWSSARAAIARSDGTPRETARRERDADASDREEREQDDGHRGFEGREDRARERHREDRRRGRHEATNEEGIERVDVGDASRQQVAAPERAESARCERFDRSVEPDADLGQDPESGEVDDVPLRVAERQRARSRTLARPSPPPRAPRTP